MKKVFISQNMRGLTRVEIEFERSLLRDKFIEFLGDQFEIIESYKPELEFKSPIHSLGQSLIMLADADILLAPIDRFKEFLRYDASNIYSRGLLRGVEAEIFLAKNYGIPTFFYWFDENKSEVNFALNPEYI